MDVAEKKWVSPVERLLFDALRKDRCENCGLEKDGMHCRMIRFECDGLIKRQARVAFEVVVPIISCMKRLER